MWELEKRKDLLTKWIAALRSGKYEQGKGKLKRTCNGETSYCCLGVLCEIAGLDSRISVTDIDEITEFHFPREDGKLTSYGVASLPYAFAKALGIDSMGDVIGNKGDPLYVMNDANEARFSGVRHHTFVEIADILEKHPEWYFKEFDNVQP